MPTVCKQRVKVFDAVTKEAAIRTIDQGLDDPSQKNRHIGHRSSLSLGTGPLKTDRKATNRLVYRNERSIIAMVTNMSIVIPPTFKKCPYNPTTIHTSQYIPSVP